ncbi:hypothetical protein AV530_000111 [Patagioenas fasciata monilis]|uniref:Uncharacterized protein n=1 Tax=Patagioenas fasciata monilis TaxID=372326 RepID=A0A1V4K034_PATFA|nr:hypothetical protein AV530_000111 [Patagioenas fasciata monilis]
MERAVVGLEMASYSPTGARTDGPRVWNGVLSHGQGGRNPGDEQITHVSNQLGCEKSQTETLLRKREQAQDIRNSKIQRFRV